jgi:hypothetical protein
MVLAYIMELEQQQAWAIQTFSTWPLSKFGVRSYVSLPVTFIILVDTVWHTHTHTLSYAPFA